MLPPASCCLACVDSNASPRLQACEPCGVQGPHPSFYNPLAWNSFLVEWMQVREAWGSRRLGVGVSRKGPRVVSTVGYSGISANGHRNKNMPRLYDRPRLPPFLQVCRHLLSGQVFWRPVWVKLSHRWAEVICSVCCCSVGSLILSLGCCSPKASTSWRKGQPSQPHGMTASSATLPMTSQYTCLDVSTVAIPSAKHACGGWILQPMNNTGSPVHSADKVPLCPVEG